MVRGNGTMKDLLARGKLVDWVIMLVGIVLAFGFLVFLAHHGIDPMR